MYQVLFKNGSVGELTDYRAEKILLFQKQGMVTARQREWLKKVREIRPIRKNVDLHTLAVTKDMTCECPKCQ